MARPALPKSPNHSLRKICFVRVVFCEHQLEYLVKIYGADKAVMGFDCPLDIAENDPVGHIAGAGGLTTENKVKGAGLITAALLDL